MLKDSLLFAYGFLKKPFAVATLLQSSRFVVGAVSDQIDHFNGAHVIVELGAGLGRITRMLCTKLPERSELLCFEREPIFADRLKARFQSGRVHVIGDDAANLKHHLQTRGHEHADCIVSAIPLNTPRGEELLAGIAPCLKPGGRFIQVSMARKSVFERDFHHLSRRFVLWNLPPECVHICVKK